MKISIFFVALFTAFLSCFAQEDNCKTDKAINEINVAKQYYGKNKYVELKSGYDKFFSANEYREFVSLKVGKKYVFVFKTEVLIDQTSISLLNSYNAVVQSVFKETGQERSLVVMEYTPNFSGNYTFVLKTVDYTGKSVCGAWLVMEKDLTAK